MPQDPYRYFRPEARNLLDQFAQGILELEKNGSSAGAVQRLLRLAHTLKGAARVVRQSTIAERAHAIEDTLAPFRESTTRIGRDNIDAILAHLDEINSQIVTLVPNAADASPDRNKPAGGPQTAGADSAKIISSDVARDLPRMISAETADVDAVLDGVAETHAKIKALRRGAGTIEHLGHLADLLRAHTARAMPVERKRGADPVEAIAEELCRGIADFAQELDATTAQMDRELRQLRDAAEGLRLIPVNAVLMALKRTARDAARALDKAVNFASSGGDIRLDAAVLGAIQAALIQIVRNAVAHGIEPESERFAAGKPPAGAVTVDVSRRGRKILFTCRDDGRGIDRAAVRNVAVERKLLDPAAGELGPDDLVALLLRGGVSTSAEVTGVSGRGVGLDVVRETVERLDGEVSVHSEPGQGTSFALLIPGSVTSTVALLVAPTSNGQTMALPLDCVRCIVRVASGDVANSSNGRSIVHEQQAIPFIPLSAALAATPWPGARAWTAVIVAATDRIAAIGVESLIGAARVVARPLPERFGFSPIAAGAALDGGGNPQIILDPDALVSVAYSIQTIEKEDASEKTPVLVVDDSLTTRMLEKSILESAGYEVDVASSGEEGLALARRKRFSLILCDVEMPGIDGFTFVERIRADPGLRNIPAILVTSRAAPEDRQRGREVGAHGYIVKSEFNQAGLLTMIQPMVAVSPR